MSRALVSRDKPPVDERDRFANTAMVRPANAGNAAGIVIGCLLIFVAVAVLSIVALIFLGSQVSTILSTVGESV